VVELPPQVLLKVHFAEISRSGAIQIGVGFIRTNREAQNHLAFFPGAPGFAPKDDFIPPPGAAPGPNLTFSSVIDFFFGTGFLEGSQARSVGFFMRALQEKGHIRTLAEPTLRVVSGKKANFLVGGEAPIPVPGQDGSVTIAYKPFGIQLEFTPKVKENGMVDLTVKPEVSSIDNTIAIVVQGFNIPGFKKSNTNTQVELRDGQTMAISGLLSETTAKNLGQVPFIGDIPILGELFKSRDFQDNKTELIVLITPTVIRQDKVKELVLPNSGFMVGRTPGVSRSPGKKEGRR
jgi:pilus assembly protein CpaC